MSATYPTKLLVAFRSGDKCAKCKRQLTPENIPDQPCSVGEAAHIYGEKQGARRYDPKMTQQDRDAYANLIYMCESCHGEIDDTNTGEIAFPVVTLQQMKKEHERIVRAAMLHAFRDVDFAELEEATRWAKQITSTGDGFGNSPPPPEEKIRKNSLTAESRSIIVQGLAVATEVNSYIEAVALDDDEFPDRLKAGFLEEYYRRGREGMKGDDLFDMMCRFASRGYERQSQKSAGIAVLVALFEKCEVFES